MMLMLYWLSLAVIVVAAVYFVLAPCCPGGPVSAFMVGGVAIFALAAFEHRPPPAIVGMVACLAGAILWAWARWWWDRKPAEGQA